MTLINRSRERMPRKYLLEWERCCRSAIAASRGAKAGGARSSDVPKELTIIFVGTSEMKRLNREYRGRNYATDVLSFNQSPDEGELVICPAVLRKNALRGDLSIPFLRANAGQGGRWSYRAELALIVLHGMLHLAGYEHSEKARLTEPMLRLQNRIFAKLFSL